MRKLLIILSMMLLVLVGCGEDSTRGYSSDPNEFPSDLQALENGATLEEATAIADSTVVVDSVLSESENVSDDISTGDEIDALNDQESDNENESTDDVIPEAGEEIQTESTSDGDESDPGNVSETPNPEEKPEITITLVLNTNSMKAHCPDCSSVDDMKPANRLDYTGTVDEVISMGYEACKRCNPF